MGGKNEQASLTEFCGRVPLGEAELKQLSCVPLTLEVLSARSNPTYFKLKEHS